MEVDEGAFCDLNMVEHLPGGQGGVRGQGGSKKWEVWGQ